MSSFWVSLSRINNSFYLMFFSTWIEFGSLKRKVEPKRPSWALKQLTAPSRDSETWPSTRWTSQPASSPMPDGRLRYLSINLRDRDLSEGSCDWFSTATFCGDWMNQNVIIRIKAVHFFLNFPLWLKDEATIELRMLAKCNYAGSLLHSCGF